MRLLQALRRSPGLRGEPAQQRSRRQVAGASPSNPSVAQHPRVLSTIRYAALQPTECQCHPMTDRWTMPSRICNMRGCHPVRTAPHQVNSHTQVTVKVGEPPVGRQDEKVLCELVRRCSMSYAG